MKGVPTGFGSKMPALARIMIAETIDLRIPNRVEEIDEQRFAQRNPDVVNDQIAAMEIMDGKIGGCLHGFPVIFKSGEQRRTHLQGGRNHQPLPPALRNRLADINGHLKVFRAGIPLPERLIGVEIAMVVNGINACSRKWFDSLQRNWRGFEHRTDDAPSQILLLKRIVGVLIRGLHDERISGRCRVPVHGLPSDRRLARG